MHLLIAAVVAVSGLRGRHQGADDARVPGRPAVLRARPGDAPLPPLAARPHGRTARARGTDGRYRILLPPGYYTVSTVERIGITPEHPPAAGSTSAPATSTGWTSRSTPASASVDYGAARAQHHAFAVFIPAALVLLAIPGPAVLYIVARASRAGAGTGSCPSRASTSARPSTSSPRSSASRR